MSITTQDVGVFRIYIKAPIQKVWDYIVDPAFNGTYGYGAPSLYDLSSGGKYECPSTPAMLKIGAPPVMVDGKVIQSDPPKLLVQTWKAYFTPETIAEGEQTVTWELDEDDHGLTSVTLTHEYAKAPVSRVFVTATGEGEQGGGGGGWAWILSDLKTVLETGKSNVAPH